MDLNSAVLIFFTVAAAYTTKIRVYSLALKLIGSLFSLLGSQGCNGMTALTSMAKNYLDRINTR